MKEASDKIPGAFPGQERRWEWVLRTPPETLIPRFRAPLRPHSLLPPYLPVLRFLQAHAGLHGHEIIHPSSGQGGGIPRNRSGHEPRRGNGHALLWRGNALHALGHASGASHGNPGPSRARGQTGTNSSFEANPATFTEKKVRFWRSLGMTRVSLGVQSLDSGTPVSAAGANIPRPRLCTPWKC